MVRVGYPLVCTEMIAPTGRDDAPALSSEDAADWVSTAILTRPVELYPTYTRVPQAPALVSPRAVDAAIWWMGI